MDVSGVWGEFRSGFRSFRAFSSVGDEAAAADLASRTVKAKARFASKSLAKRVGVKMVSSKAKVTFTVASSSRKICVKSGTSLRTLKKGNCRVTFTVQEPKPKKGKALKPRRTTKTLVVQ